jgi:hypothetical protein
VNGKKLSVRPLVLVSLIVIAACGGRVVVAESSDAASGPRADTASPASDSSAPADSRDPPGDAPTGITVTLRGKIFEDCMPIVADDPVSIDGEVVVANGGSTPIGPLTATLGSVKTPLGSTLATYRIKGLSIGALAAGESGGTTFHKEKGSMFPAAGCDAVKCGAGVQLELTLYGAGLPPAGIRALSPVIEASCAF